MLRIRINILLAMVLASGVWACAPRGTPAPVIMGAGGTANSAYPATSGWRGSVVVQPGDTLYAISRYHKMALQALIEANDLGPPFIIKPGQVLRLPEPGAPLTPATGSRHPIASKPLSPTPVPPAPRQQVKDGQEGRDDKKHLAAAGAAGQKPAGEPVDHTSDSGEDQTSGFEVADDKMPPQPQPAPAQKKVGVLKEIARPSAPSPAPAPAIKLVRFLWPAKGPILSDFGPKENGLHNDGINIAMPPNGPVAAAGDGVVSYAGSGLRGYGNLLLIRHEGGWVTAYAHNSELLVEKGAAVKRGQIIAKAGRSGGVPQDQLHFEVRQGAKAVDPKPLLVGG